MWVDGVGRGHVSRHVKPWTHISIPCIAKEALRPTSKTGTDQGDSSHVAVQKLLTLLFPPIAGICRQSMASIMGSQGRTPDRFSRTCPAPFPRRAITVSLEPSPYHPPVHQRSFLFHFYHAALLMAINSASSSVPDSVPGAVENPPEIAGVRTGRRHRRRRQSTRDHKRTQRAPSPAPLAVHPRSQAYAQGTVTGAVGSPPAISGARTGRRHRRRQQSPPGRTVSESARWVAGPPTHIWNMPMSTLHDPFCLGSAPASTAPSSLIFLPLISPDTASRPLPSAIKTTTPPPTSVGRMANLLTHFKAEAPKGWMWHPHKTSRATHKLPTSDTHWSAYTARRQRLTGCEKRSQQVTAVHSSPQHRI